MSNGQSEADVKWPIRSWCQMANQKLMSNCQWEAYVKGPMRSWCWIANEISLSQSLYYGLSLCWQMEIMSVFIASIDHFDLVLIPNICELWNTHVVRTFCAQNKFFIRRHFACCFVLSATCATLTALDNSQWLQLKANSNSIVKVLSKHQINFRSHAI